PRAGGAQRGRPTRYGRLSELPQGRFDRAELSWCGSKLPSKVEDLIQAKLKLHSDWLSIPPFLDSTLCGMSRGLDIERNDSRDPTSLRDHRKEAVGRDRERSTRVEIRSLDRERIPAGRQPLDHD